MIMKRIAIVSMLALCVGTTASASITVEASVYPERIYRNQSFRIALSIRTRDVRLGGRIRVGGLFEDGRIVQIEDFRELAAERSMDGLAVLENRRFVCMARAENAGAIELKPTVHLLKRERRRTSFGVRWAETPVTVAAKPLRLNILPLPPEPPDGFSGAVGQFSFETELSASEAAVGDLITLRMRIQGEGYWDAIDLPQVKAAPFFSVYEPKTVSGASSRALVYEQTLVPRSDKATTIPALTFRYFDPVRGDYASRTRGPFRLVLRETEAVDREETFRPDLSEQDGDLPVPDAARVAGREESRMALRWRALSNRLRGRELAATARRVSARLAPASGALTTFRIPADAELTVLESHNGWVKVQYRNNRGWIPADALAWDDAGEKAERK